MVTQNIIVSTTCPSGWNPIYLRLSSTALKTGEQYLTTNYHTPRTLQELRNVLHEIDDPKSATYRDQVRYIHRCANGMFSRRDAETIWALVNKLHKEKSVQNIVLIPDARLKNVAHAAGKAINDTLFGTNTNIADIELNTYVYGLMIAYMPHTFRHIIKTDSAPTPDKKQGWFAGLFKRKAPRQ